MLIQFKRFIWPVIYRWRKLTYPILLKQYEQNLKKKYTARNTIPGKRRLIFMQDENFSQGGLVDRMKGIVSAFYLAKYYNLNFSVFFSDVKNPMIPYINRDAIEIIIERASINFNSQFSRPLVWYNFFPKFRTQIKNSLFSKNEIHLYCNMNLLQSFINSELEMRKAWSDVFSQLFKLPILKNENKIGIHLRFIGLLGDFIDLRKHQLDDNQLLKMIDWCGDKILEIGSRYPDRQLQVVSDSSKFLLMLEENEKFKKIKKRIKVGIDNIGHTAMDVKEEVFRKTVEDFVGLRSCEKVIQLRWGKMHRSDFSKYAAMSSLKQFELIENNG